MSDDEKDHNRLMFFGQNLGEIPCFRDSLLNGIGTGIGAGLAYFLYSSRVKMSTHVGFGVFMAATMGNWTYCRYNYAKLKFEMAQLKKAMQNRALHEGTSQEAIVDGKMGTGLDLKSV